MLVTLVIRLVPEGLAAGKFVGQVEHIGTGDRQLVHEVSDLVGFAERAGLEYGRGPGMVEKASEESHGGRAHDR